MTVICHRYDSFMTVIFCSLTTTGQINLTKEMNEERINTQPFYDAMGTDAVVMGNVGQR